MTVKWKAITPSTLKVDRIRLELLNGLRTFGRQAVRDAKKITDPWDNEKPSWKFKVSLSGGSPSVLIDPGSGLGADKWVWLDEGTDVRYATMTPNFQPKTRRGVVSSGNGQGGVLFVNTSQPRPGIEPREFSKTLLKAWGPIYEDIMQSALDKGAALSGHLIKG